MVCPAPYVGCPAPLEVPAPVKQKVCASGDLQSAGSACATGLLTSACINFLTFESGSNVDCGNCLQRFAFDFADQTGVLLCAAPYVDAACNHQSACLADCLAQSCYGCADVSSKEQCETQAQTAGCSAFVQTDGCGAQALAGPAAFCNPATYQALPNQAGAWFQAVATAYCAQ